MSFCSEIEVDSDPEGTDCLMDAPLSPVFPSQTNEKKKPNENIEISSAGESKEFLQTYPGVAEGVKYWGC